MSGMIANRGSDSTLSTELTRSQEILHSENIRDGILISSWIVDVFAMIWLAVSIGSHSFGLWIWILWILGIGIIPSLIALTMKFNGFKWYSESSLRNFHWAVHEYSNAQTAWTSLIERDQVRQSVYWRLAELPAWQTKGLEDEWLKADRLIGEADQQMLDLQDWRDVVAAGKDLRGDVTACNFLQHDYERAARYARDASAQLTLIKGRCEALDQPLSEQLKASAKKTAQELAAKARLRARTIQIPVGVSITKRSLGNLRPHQRCGKRHF